MSIRRRLTLFYGGILALTLIVFGLAVYLMVGRATWDVLHQTLAAKAQGLIASAEYQPSRNATMPDIYVQTRDVAGQVDERSPNLGQFTLPLSEQGWAAIAQGRSWSEATLIEDRRLLVYSQPIVIDGRSLGTLQVARSLAGHDEALAILRVMLLPGCALIILAALGTGWVLAGAALRPIARITQTADAIGLERDLGKRVDHQGPNDEVGQLAATLNRMLVAIQTAYAQVEDTLRAQRQFVADASHELRTPLTSLRGNIALLRREPPIAEADRQAVLADMTAEAARMSRLVNDLLRLARTDAGKALARDAVPLPALLADAVRAATVLGRPIETDDPVPVAVLGDRDALKQVLLNLIENAHKFTPANGTVAIATEVTGDRVAISVCDTGVGIPSDELPRIFDRFYRGEAPRPGSGTGLGLAIAKTLVAAQGGTLTAESRPGVGSVFTMRLDRARTWPGDGIVPRDRHDAVRSGAASRSSQTPVPNGVRS